MRIDNYLSENSRFGSRTKAKEAVFRGEVLVNGKKVKPSYEVGENDVITFLENAGAYVSNGAFKLLKAFEVFDFSVNNLMVADIGASTGGFTQVCLENGAKKVFAIDVGENLLHPTLVSNEKVVVVDNTNARTIDENTFGMVDAVVSDVSFISLTYVLPSISKILKDMGEAVVLIKPQFECGPKALSKNGIVTDPKHRMEACKTVISTAEGLGLVALDLSYAPINEGKNVEFLLHLKKGAIKKVNDDKIRSVCLKN